MELARKTLFQRRWLLGLSAILLLSLPFFFWGPLKATLGLGPQALLLGGWITSLVFATRRPVRALRLSRSALVVDGQAIPREALRAGWFTPSSGRVVIDAPSRIEIDVTDEDEARRILAALELDVAHRAVRFRVEPPPTHTFAAAKALGFILTFCAVLFASKGAVYLLAFPALLAASLFWTSYEIHIGSDGVLIASRFRRRFFPIATIRDAVIDKQAIALVTDEGRIPIAALPGPNDRAPKDEIGAAIVARIREATKGHTTDRHARVADLLDRRDQPLREWLARLASFGTASYRETGIRREEVVSVLEHHASSWVRLGAAIVLAQDPDERPRVRIAAEACAEPHLRVALDAAARGDDLASLEDAATPLDAPAVARAQSR